MVLLPEYSIPLTFYIAMIQIPIHKVFIYNGQVKPGNEFIVSENTGGIYEVLRVYKGVPLFVEEHLERFYFSAKLARREIKFTKSEISGFISLLINENQISEGNILISCKNNLKAFFIKHNYPEEKWYETGVLCGILYAERENPNAKVFQTSVRQRADTLIVQEGYYEVVLVDHSGYITEGSRSNVFFVKEENLYTPPGKGVLLGITRQKTLQLASELGFKIIEEDILLKHLNDFDGLFLTGTSPKILPVSTVGNFTFNAQNKVVQNIRIAYDQLIDRYVREYNR